MGDLLEGGLQNQVSDDVDEQYDLGNGNGEDQKDEEEKGEHRPSQDDVVDEEDLQKGEGDVEEEEERRLKQDHVVDDEDDEDEVDEDLLCDGHIQVLCCVHDAHDEKTWNEKNEVYASCDVFVVVAVDEALRWNLGESFALFPLYSRIEIHEFHLRRWLSIQPKK